MTARDVYHGHSDYLEIVARAVTTSGNESVTGHGGILDRVLAGRPRLEDSKGLREAMLVVNGPPPGSKEYDKMLLRCLQRMYPDENENESYFGRKSSPGQLKLTDVSLVVDRMEKEAEGDVKIYIE